MLLKRKIFVFSLLLWFALLQTLAPFVHAHLGNDKAHPEMSGLHIHAINIKLEPSKNLFEISPHNVSTNDFGTDAHIVLMEDGIPASSKVSIKFIALLLLVVLPLFVSIPQQYYSFSPLIRLPACACASVLPRAPPLF